MYSVDIHNTHFMTLDEYSYTVYDDGDNARDYIPWDEVRTDMLSKGNVVCIVPRISGRWGDLLDDMLEAANQGELSVIGPRYNYNSRNDLYLFYKSAEGYKTPDKTIGRVSRKGAFVDICNCCGATALTANYGNISDATESILLNYDGDINHRTFIFYNRKNTTLNEEMSLLATPINDDLGLLDLGKEVNPCLDNVVNRSLLLRGKSVTSLALRTSKYFLAEEVEDV